MALLWPAFGPDLANRSSPPSFHQVPSFYATCGPDHHSTCARCGPDLGRHYVAIWDSIIICIVIILGVSRLLVNTIWSHFVVPAGITKGEKVFGLYSFSLVLQVCLLSCHMCKIAKCSVICVQGILLDEASGVSRTQQPVMPAGYQPPKIVVSSWNRRVSFSAHSSFNLGKYLLEREISLTWSRFDKVWLVTEEPVLAWWQLFLSLQGGERRDETFHLLHAKNIQRPQLKFKEKVDNSNTPFVSKIFIKPNAVKPLPSCECVQWLSDIIIFFLKFFTAFVDCFLLIFILLTFSRKYSIRRSRQ